MKKLICAKDVEGFIAQGKSVVYIDSNTIITPSAKDIADASGIKFLAQEEKEREESPKLEGIDSDQIYKVIKILMEKGLLDGIFKPYEAESYSNGLKVVRGNTVRMDVFETKDLDTKVFYQELISKNESHMSAGFLEIDNSEFEWELTYEEVDYVIEGTVNITIDGRTFTAYKGDVLFIPSGSKVIWGAKEKTKLFYTTYPANWADLI